MACHPAPSPFQSEVGRNSCPGTSKATSDETSRFANRAGATTSLYDLKAAEDVQLPEIASLGGLADAEDDPP
jgi:hypothetical protein